MKASTQFFILLLFILSTSIASAKYSISCSYIDKVKGLSIAKNCIKIDEENRIAIHPNVRKKMHFLKNNLAEIHFSSNCYWTDRRVTVMKTHCFDNGSDEFSEGFARYISDDGKFGFMNEKLKVAIPAKYDFVFPFKNGKARYCFGCKSISVDQEHNAMSGGQWGTVDRNGNESPENLEK